ncbi:helix-turn-helix domain-containing protein [Deinococcus altitudinis]|uniref:AraC family transcriptional regulator n=1 Tax=Deinococcus altitudinis TaxID=468914 RepID=UPI003891D723
MPRRLVLPSPTLRPLVQFYALLSGEAPRAEQHSFLPEHTAHLTFHTGNSWVLSPDGLMTPLPTATLDGLVTAPTALMSEGPVRALRAELYPWAARHLFGWSYPEAPLDLLGGAAGPRSSGAARKIQAALAAHDDEAALGLLDDWLLGLLAERVWTPGVGVRAAVQLYPADGMMVGEPVRMADLAEELGVSPRTLERQFLQEVGIGAKTLSRLIRFETAYNTLSGAPQTPLASLAYEMGFADQAHLTREFRALSGLTPGHFARLAGARGQPEFEGSDVLDDNPRLLRPVLPD